MALLQANSSTTSLTPMNQMKKSKKSPGSSNRGKLQSGPSTGQTKEKLVDPWSFLDLIEAPQWVDLSVEETFSTDPDSTDPWFDSVHRHHVISLADKNTDMKWLRLSKPKNKASGVEVAFVTTNGMKKHQQVASKSTRKTNVDQSKKLSGHVVHKEAAWPNDNNMNRSPGTKKTSSSRCSGSQSSFSGSSGISMNSSLNKYCRRSCSERLSVTSRFKDAESPREDSVLTTDSASLYVEENALSNSSERIGDDQTRTTVARKFGDDLRNTDQVSSKNLAESVTVKAKKTGILSLHQTSRAVAQFGVNYKENKADGHHSVMESFQRQLPITGKENLKPDINGKRVSSSDLSITRTSKINLGSMGTNSREKPQSDVRKSSAKWDSNVMCAMNQKKRVDTWQSATAGSVSTKISQPEMDLADLVAQHNQKIKTLRLHGFQKGLR